LYAYNTIVNAKNITGKDVSGVGVVTNLIFSQFYNASFRNPDLINDTKNYYYSFYNLYKFYSIDIFRTSFLFFENVRHSTKLEIV